MSVSTCNLLVAIAACLFLGAPVQSLRANESSLHQCSQSVQSIAAGERHFNSTGSMSFLDPTTTSWERNEWYLSMLFYDIRETEPRAPHPHQFLDVFLSVPGSEQSINASEASNASTVCGYQLQSQDAVVEYPESPERSCETILSDDCMQLLLSFPRPALDGCPRPPSIHALCGTSIYSWAREPVNVFNSTCGLDDLPQIGLPEDYRSLETGLGGGLRTMGQYDDTTYDTLVRRPIPIVLTGRRDEDDERGWSRVVCLAPEEVVEGSREPEGDAARPAAQIWMAFGAALGVVASLTWP